LDVGCGALSFGPWTLDYPVNPRITIGLGVLLVILGAFYVLGGGTETPGGFTGAGTPTPVPPEIIGYSVGEITRVTVRSGSDTLALQQDPSGTWVYGRGLAEPSNAVDQGRWGSVMARLGNLKARGRVSDALADAQKGEYGLVQPEIEAMVGSDRDRVTLQIGAQNPTRTGYYAQLAGAPALYLVDTLLVDDLKRLLTQPPDPPTPTPVPTATPAPEGTATPGPTETRTP